MLWWWWYSWLVAVLACASLLGLCSKKKSKGEESARSRSHTRSRSRKLERRPSDIRSDGLSSANELPSGIKSAPYPTSSNMSLGRSHESQRSTMHGGSRLAESRHKTMGVGYPRGAAKSTVKAFAFGEVPTPDRSRIFENPLGFPNQSDFCEVTPESGHSDPAMPIKAIKAIARPSSAPPDNDSDSGPQSGSIQDTVYEDADSFPLPDPGNKQSGSPSNMATRSGTEQMSGRDANTQPSLQLKEVRPKKAKAAVVGPPRVHFEEDNSDSQLTGRGISGSSSAASSSQPSSQPPTTSQASHSPATTTATESLYLIHR